MNKKWQHLSSEEAASMFKKEIDKCLGLLGFLNSNDKEDVWKFWKTVSSAIKIALNGKGDIISPRRNSKCSGRKDEERNEEELCRLKNLAQDATTIYVPLSSDTAQKRFHVLKLFNQEKIDEYVEIVSSSEDPCDQKIESGTMKTEQAEYLSNDFHSHLELSPDKIIAQISQLGAESERPLNEEETLKVEICDETMNNSLICDNILVPNKEISTVADLHQPSHSSNSNQENFEEETSISCPVMKKAKVIAKSWPVTRPTTRQSSRAKKRNSVFEIVPVKMRNDKLSMRLMENEESFQSEVIISSAPHQKINENESYKENHRIDKLFLLDGETPKEEKAANEILPPTENPVISNSSVSEVSTKEIMCIAETNAGVNITPEETKENELMDLGNGNSSSNEKEVLFQDSNGNKNQEQTVVSQEDLNENENISESVDDAANSLAQDIEGVDAQRQAPPKSSSDIETIISALEEELKKSDSVQAISIGNDQLTTSDVDNTTATSDADIVHLLPKEEIVAVENVEDVIWNQDGTVHFVANHSLVDTVDYSTHPNAEEVVIHPVDVQYDVVEYEVLAEKGKPSKSIGGKRRKKGKEQGEDKDALDRTCPMCHRVLTYPSSMGAHMRTHTGDRPFSCGQCDRKFTTKANRDRHEATHIGLKPFKCVQCEKCFTEKRSLKIHMRSHTGERPFVCTVCDRAFTQKCTLMVHMDRHTNRKGHLCDLCGKAFRQKCQLDIHVKRHNRQANYPCPECPVKCYTKGDLVRHMIKHTGERPFHCALCPRTFTRKQYLVDHENTHYGRKPYKCSVCSVAFHDMGSCHRHIRKHREEAGKDGKDAKSATILTADDYNTIVKGSEVGKLLTLEDGTQAFVTAVDTEADGSMVYHIRCVSTESEETSETSEMKVEEEVDTSLKTEDTSVPPAAVDELHPLPMEK